MFFKKVFRKMDRFRCICLPLSLNFLQLRYNLVSAMFVLLYTFAFFFLLFFLLLLHKSFQLFVLLFIELSSTHCTTLSLTAFMQFRWVRSVNFGFEAWVWKNVQIFHTWIVASDNFFATLWAWPWFLPWTLRWNTFVFAKFYSLMNIFNWFCSFSLGEFLICTFWPFFSSYMFFLFWSLGGQVFAGFITLGISLFVWSIQ